MISNEQRKALTKWFRPYTLSFISGRQDYDQDIELKISHSYRVASHIIQIAASVDMDPGQQNLAFFCGLLHDIGRFEQYKQYKTYDDALSEDHAELGVRVMDTLGVLDGLAAGSKQIIVEAVHVHNKKQIPDSLDEESRLYAMMVRDADKLDILHILCKLIRQNNYNNEVALRLPDQGPVSEKVFARVMNQEPVDYQELTSYNDLKIISMAWLNDLNFLYAFDVYRSQHYLEILRDSIGEDARGLQVYERYAALLEKTCIENS